MKVASTGIDNSLRRMRNQVILACLGALVLVTGMTTFLHREQKKRTAVAIAQSVEKNLAIGDLRESIASLSRSAVHVFERVEFVDRSDRTEKVVFAIPTEATPTPWSVIRNGQFRYPVLKTVPKGEPLAELVFYFDLFGAMAFVFLAIPALAMIGWVAFRRGETRIRQEVGVLLKLREAEAKSAIAAQVAHDIRSPLAALKVASREAAQLSEEARGLLLGAVDRVHGIAEDLLKKSRETAGEISPNAPPEFTPHKLYPLLEGILKEKRVHFHDRAGLELALLTETTCRDSAVLLDPNELMRALSNLINNAVEAIDGPGRVEVRLSAAAQGNIAIEVMDNGRGIPPELLNVLGTRGATFGKANGNGLGLAHARGFVERMGGEFEIISSPGAGTCIRLILPMAQAQRA